MDEQDNLNSNETVPLDVHAFKEESQKSDSDKIDINLIDAPEYLESFNVDTGDDADANVPHYIVNLNVYDTSSDMDALSPLTTSHTLNVDTTTPSVSLPNVSAGSGDTSLVSTAIPVSQVPQPIFMPMMRSKARARARLPPVPLDDVMERKIRTFEGRDCVQHLDQLQKLFPRFKKAYINRVFTRNMLNYDKTYQQLKEEDDRELEKCANVRLIQAPKQSDIKRGTDGKSGTRPELPLSSQAFLFMGVPLGRCPPHIANTLYRRVIVTPDGTVEPADEHEKKFLNSSGLSESLITSPRTEPRPRKRPVTTLFHTSPFAHHPLKLTDEQHSEPTSSQNETDENPPQPQTGNRFFRTNRVCEAEMKKRDYLNRELRGAATVGSTLNRSNNANLTKTDVDTNEDGSRRSGDAVKYMAKLGVVSNSTSRKKSGRRRSTQPKRVNNERKEGIDSDTNDTSLTNTECLDDGLDLTFEERKHLLSFFNDATLEELSLMPGCSRKTAQTLISLRPFANTSDLVNRLSGTRYLSSNLIESCKDILQMRSSIVRLLQRCERLTEQVNSHAACLLENTVSLPDDLTRKVPHSATDESTTVDDYDVGKIGTTQMITQQPALLNPLRELKPYQLVGLNWLRLLHHEQVNGILADEMGLGKTVQAIAFLASLWESGDRGPHLIICPSSTQDNWQRELALWCPNLKVLVYQGSAEQRKAIRLKVYEAGSQHDFNVLLTSYAVGTSSIEDRALMKRVNFHYGIFDEAHMLKNMTSQRYRNLMNFRVQRRLLLTGTPLQNNLLELISLLSFVMPEMFMHSSELLKRMFQIYSKPVHSRNDECNPADRSNRSNFEEERLLQAKNLLQPFCLRRLKSQVLSQLPPKTTEIIRLPMTSNQAIRYSDLVEQFRSLKVVHTMNITAGEATTSSVMPSSEVENGEVTEPPSPKKLRSDVNSAVNGSQSPLPNGSTHEPLPNQSSANMIVALRKAANHVALLSGLAYSDDTLRDIAETLHLDPSHSNSDPQLILEDLRAMSDHQVHKVCQFYEILSSYTLSPEYIISGSGKIEWLNTNLPRLLAEGHRILIFSQFVIMLDILEEFLKITDRRYVRMDGSTPVSERQALVDRFNSSSIEVFLLSTRAGGLGINLTGADTVIIHDIDFNPYNDRQAEDRCHRLGQKNPVHVIRLISSDSVEEGILRIASDKLLLEQNVTGIATDDLSPTDLEEEGSTVAEHSKQLKLSNDNANVSQISQDDLTESRNVFKVLSSWNLTDGVSSLPTSINDGTPASSLVTRVSDTDVRSLLTDALKL